MCCPSPQNALISKIALYGSGYCSPYLLMGLLGLQVPFLLGLRNTTDLKDNRRHANASQDKEAVWTYAVINAAPPIHQLQGPVFRINGMIQIRHKALRQHGIAEQLRKA